MIATFNRLVSHPDAGKLVLRVGFGFLFLLHGIAKIFKGTAGIEALLVQKGLPAFIAYGVYLGEVVAPVLIIIGLLTRLSAFVGVGTCVFIILLAHSQDIFALGKTGGWVPELSGLFLLGFLGIMFLGSGKYAVRPD